MLFEEVVEAGVLVLAEKPCQELVLIGVCEKFPMTVDVGKFWVWSIFTSRKVKFKPWGRL